MFECFTAEAIEVIMCAQEESRRMGHNYVGTEQILLGLILEGTGVAAKTLKSLGFNIKDARTAVKKIIGRGRGFVGVELPFTPEMIDILQLVEEEARQSQRNIDTEHLLLGLFKESNSDNVAVNILKKSGLDLPQIRLQIDNPVILADSSDRDNWNLMKLFRSLLNK